MKIGFDAKRIFHNTTGLGNYGRNVVTALSQYYPEYHYFLYHPKPSTITDFQIPASCQEILPNSFFSKIFHAWWRERGMTQNMNQHQIDLFHGLSNELPIGIEKIGIKTVVTIHDLIFLRFPQLYSFFDRKNYQRKVKRACQVADQIIAISEQTKNDLVQFFQIHPERIIVCYQSCHVAFKKSYSQEQKKQIRQKFQLPQHYILNVGTIEERKNLLSAIKAIRTIDMPLVVVGRKKKDYFQKIQKYIAQHQLQQRVIFLEGVALEELACLYQMAELFMYLSIFEGFGIPIIEALYCQTPVIAATGSCLEEAGGKHSLYHSPDDVEAIQQSIIRVLENSETQELMKEKGREHAQQFDDQVIAKHLMKIYQS